MTPRPTVGLRRKVIARARGRCEYCLIHQNDTYITYHLDHVIAEKHGGPSNLKNLALSCMPCNRRKGSDISSIDPITGEICPLFNPRAQKWTDHFYLDGAKIIGRTPHGRTTVVLLQLNSNERILEREELIIAGQFSVPS